MKEKTKKWKRKCPKCGDEISYTQKSHKNRAEKRNTNCLSCSTTERFFSKNARKRMSEANLGDKNPAKRPEVRKKISESLTGIKLTDEHKKNISESLRGKKCKPFTDKHKKNIRLSVIKRIEKNNGQISPNYSPVGCGIINDYNKKYGFNFQHAENGGEVCIGGYFPDGLGEKRKTIIEIDEPRHYDVNGKLKQKDIQRQKYLESLGYKVIRIRI
jgi:hypothetical protein